MSDISKYSHLLSLLKGEAKQVINGLGYTAANYKNACDKLKGRFGRKELVIFSHIQALLTTSFEAKGKGKAYIANHWTLYDELLSHIRSLAVLGISNEQ